ncbi:toll/interleukin-1 receptor domain-containing protein [Amycolatopsis aidingensis]|uniref:toll/interleukin-1 receptor domain-containing protein n=1 Tax=Amycolatopsis aidingensis TaxID=2842453 RepID=UPI001C0C390B|nr:toll/interleukin-1 receptor domain-containing protein [Amycolatopsis aidingensis]
MPRRNSGHTSYGPVNNSAIGDRNVVRGNSIGHGDPEPPGPLPHRPETGRDDGEIEYDLAFSFAGEHRSYVERTKLACDRLGMRVFYDRDKTNEWWGRNFVAAQRLVYGRRTRYFVPFISAEYFAKQVPSDEFEAAMWTGMERGGGYILPVLIGSPLVPAHRLHPHTGVLRAEDHTPEQLATQLWRKVRSSTGSAHHPPREISEIISPGLADLPLPDLRPLEPDARQQSALLLDRLGSLLARELPRLRRVGLAESVERSETAVVARVTRHGRTVYALDIDRTEQEDGTLLFGLDRHQPGNEAAVDATARPCRGERDGTVAVLLSDRSLLGGEPGELTLATEELLERIWHQMIRRLESRR